MQRFDQPAPRVHGPRDLLRRVTRWLSLTLIHKAIWPVLVLLAGSTMHRPASSSLGQVLGMTLGPAVAAILGWLFIGRERSVLPAPDRAGAMASQVRLIVLGLPVMLLIARMAVDDAGAAGKIALVGVGNVAAYHLIHFGVVRSMFPSPFVITMLFGMSWAVHEIAEALARDSGGSFIYHAMAGFTVGVLVGVGAQVLHRWPGGQLTAPAAHWLVIYLIFGFST
jgi:hypothetical protein